MKLSVMAVCLMFFVSGCATMRKDQGMQDQQLKVRIDSLEEELRKKDEEISNLESELAESRQRATRRGASLQLSVRKIQTALKNAGFYKGAIDGKLGPQTKKAIREFQKDAGLMPDGIVGKRTREKLSNYLSQ